MLVMHEGKLKANLINQNLTQEQVMEAALRSERHVEKAIRLISKSLFRRPAFAGLKR